MWHWLSLIAGNKLVSSTFVVQLVSTHGLLNLDRFVIQLVMTSFYVVFFFPPKCIGLQLWHFQWLNCNHSSVFVWSSWQSFCSPATGLLDTNPWPIWDVVGCMAKYFNLPITITILPCTCLCLLLWGHQSPPPHSLNCFHCQYQEVSLEEMGLLGDKSTSFKLNPTPLAQYMTHCRSYQKNSQQTLNFPPLTWRDEPHLSPALVSSWNG